jgi:folate-binding protein YgfZ
LSGAAAGAARARTAVGLAELPDAVLLRATGADRVGFLHRIVTCDVQAVPAGGAAPGLLLTPKGRVVAEFLLAVLPDRVEMVAPPAARPALRDGLARFVVADDVVLEDRAGSARLLSLVGPRAAEAARAAAGIPGVVAIPRTRAGLPAVDLIAEEAAAAPLREALAPAIAAAGGGALPADALEVLRVENGVPALGAEATGDTFPQECGLEAAVSFTKGCFLGQEPVGRLHAQGRTQRGLAGLLLDPGSPLPARGDAVLDGDREVGAVTSAVPSEALGRPIALAILRHDSASPGAALRLRTAAGPVSCTAAGLPFVR